MRWPNGTGKTGILPILAVSRNAGLASSTLANVLKRHWPKGERLIAEALGSSPEQVWPSRYNT
ncbi:helix-turn-helix domain-containing protein [Pectobacterium brasiliense]|nr:helix-turn-helix domain-containing protein [Pectobacterium brasiliense]